LLTITLRDLQWRARRFGLGVAATALVFATTLLLAGVYASFQDETSRTVRMFGGDRWIVPQGVAGPFTSGSPFPGNERVRVLLTPGVERATAVALFPQVVRDGDDEHVVNAIAYGQQGGLVNPAIVEGRGLEHAGEAVADERVGVDVGARVTVGGRPLRIVGLTRDVTYFAGTPSLLMGIHDGRQIAFGGAPMVTAIVTRGVPREPIKGMRVMDFAEVRDDLRKPVAGATTTIAVLAVILSIVAAGIIGLMSYLSNLDRLMDFAVFKAIGVRTGKLLVGLVLQVIALSVASAAGAGLLAWLLSPTLPIGVRLSAGTYLGLLVSALVVGLLVSLISVRQATSVDPALAFGRH
jgi:putative ABC transport system permease protein